MSDHDIELLKLQIQREQAARDFWKWAIMYVLVGVNPLMNLLTTYLEHRAIASVDAKADIAATKAVVLEKKADEISKDTAITNAISTKWEAGKTGDPDDMAKAQKAEAKVMQQEQLAAKPQ